MKHRFKIAAAVFFGITISPICLFQWLLTGNNLGFKLLWYAEDEMRKLDKLQKDVRLIDDNVSKKQR